jgi:hypothetical protein
MKEEITTLIMILMSIILVYFTPSLYSLLYIPSIYLSIKVFKLIKNSKKAHNMS